MGQVWHERFRNMRNPLSVSPCFCSRLATHYFRTGFARLGAPGFCAVDRTYGVLRLETQPL